MLYCRSTLIYPYLGKFFSVLGDISIEVMLLLYLTVTFMVVVSIVLSIRIKLEVNMMTIIRTFGVVGGAAFLGRSGGITSALQEMQMEQ